MRQIRRSVFETASSSVHSLTIACGNLNKPDYKGKEFDLFPGEFGWGPDQYTDVNTKASYCYTWIQYAHESERDKFKKMLVNVIKEQTGAIEVVFRQSTGEYYAEGYIDHQSTDRCAEAFESEDNLINFIFSKDSVLVIDNDNH